jgi:hypothetical protein
MPVIPRAVPFPDELVEMLSDEQYLTNAADVLFGDQHPSRIHSWPFQAELGRGPSI